MRVLLASLFALLLTFPLSAQAGRYVGDETSSSLKFDMVASLHEIHGTATSFTSELILEDDITGKVVVQGTAMKTGIGVRDKRMYKLCLDTDKYPIIEFVVRGVTGDTAGLLSKEGKGQVSLHGQLKIRSTTRDLIVPTGYSWTEGQLTLTGTKQIKWTDYGVPDPSVFISKLYPEVSIQFELQLHQSF